MKSTSVISLALAALTPTQVWAASRTSPPSGCLHVAKSGGQYSTVQAAINSLSTSSSAAQCVFIDQGTYTEQVYVADRSAQLTIYGYTTDTSSYSKNGATITYNKSAAEAGNNDASGTLRAHSTNLKVYNLNVVNSCTCTCVRGHESGVRFSRIE